MNIVFLGECIMFLENNECSIILYDKREIEYHIFV